MGELLAPVGSMEMLNAAIEGGADAVFMAGPRFGARAKEASFTMEALVAALDVAHRYGVRVYITLNTLIKEQEMAECEAYIDALAALGIDALIVQDLGVVRYVKARHPGLALHASTQMAIADDSGIEAAIKLGIQRVVIARETELSTLERFLTLGMPLEVFVHGALCYAYSGQCLLSSVQGGRSGNRGQCAQPCRLAYRLDDQPTESYAMSMKDLATVDRISEIAALGVASFKIEGRLRSPDYVFHTVRAYRAALDGVTGEALEPYKESMYQAFNREYTGGHLLADLKRLNLEMSSNKGEFVGTTKKSTQYKLQLSLAAPIYKGDGLKVVFGSQSRGIEVFNIYVGDGQETSAAAGTLVTIDFNGLIPEGSKVYRTRSRLLTEARLAAKGNRRVALEGQFSAHLGEPLRLALSDGSSRIEVQGDEPVGPAERAAADDASVRQNLEKLGDTAYSWKRLDILLDSGVFIAKSAINALRRKGIEALDQQRSQAVKSPVDPGDTKLDDKSGNYVGDNPGSYKGDNSEDGRASWHVSVRLKEQATAAIKALNRAGFISTQVRVFAPVPVYRQLLAAGTLTALEKDYLRPLLGAFEAPEEGVGAEDLLRLENEAHGACAEIGIAHMGHTHRYLGTPLALGIQSTVMNLSAYAQWQTLGVQDVLASVELSERELGPLAAMGLRVAVYGQLPVMYSRTCPKRAKGISCRDCSGSFSLTGKETQSLKVHCQNQLLTYYTITPLYRQGVYPYRLAMFVDETVDQVTTRLLALLTGEAMTIEALDAYQRPVF